MIPVYSINKEISRYGIPAPEIFQHQHQILKNDNGILRNSKIT